MSKTISMCQGKGSLAHNNRKFSAKNIDSTRTKDNVVFVREDLGEAYAKLFGGAVERYNAKQKRSDRKIDDYFKHLFNRSPSDSVITGANKQKSFYEDLVQIGTKDDTGVGTPDAEIAAECLSEYMSGFQERNPNFYAFNAVMHLDEATPHLHIDYIPIGHFSKGLDTKNAMAKALEEMGYGSGKDAINRWRMSEREVLNKICQAHGIEISEPQKSRGYSFKVQEYGEYKDEIRALESQKEQISGELEKAAKKKVKLEDIERIEVKKSAFGKSVTVSQADFDILSDAAKKYVSSEKSTKRLKEENAHLKSQANSLEKENSALKAEVGKYKLKDENSIVAALRKSQKEAEREKIRSDLAAAVQVIDRNGLRSEFETAKKLRKNEKNICDGLTNTF